MRCIDILDAAPGKLKIITLSEFTTWQIGGEVVSITALSLDELVEIVLFLEKNSIPWQILGKGSNTLAPSLGWSGVVVRLSGELAQFSFNGEFLHAGGGAHLPSMAASACSHGLSGLVFAVGIPGTSGGAVFMNAGAYGSSISDFVHKITVVHIDGNIEYLSSNDCGFGYRFSNFQKNRSVVAEVTLKLLDGISSKEKLRRDARAILQKRRDSFPLHAPNAGSVFRRPVNGPPPGKLIEDCELKGVKIGGAMVSFTHANFIENTGSATSKDVIDLIKLVINRVREVSGITLRTEVRLLGAEE